MSGIMDSPERGALMLVRFSGAALIGWALIELALYYLVAQHNGTPIKVVPCLVRAIPLVAGVVMLVKARTLAAWVSEKLDL